MRNLHELQIKTAVEAVASRKEVNEVYFVACGVFCSITCIHCK